MPQTHRDTPVIIVFFVQVGTPNHLVIGWLAIFESEGFFYFFVIVNVIIPIGVLFGDHITSPDQSILHQAVNDAAVQFSDFPSIEKVVIFFVEEFVGLRSLDPLSGHSPAGVSEGLLRSGCRLLDIIPCPVFIQGDRKAAGGDGTLLILNARYYHVAPIISPFFTSIAVRAITALAGLRHFSN